VLVESAGTRRGGCRLTPEGRRIREKFRAWFAAVEKVAVDQARSIFADRVQSYDEKVRSASGPSRKAAERRPSL
jgi:molybdate transport system regulatory protein